METEGINLVFEDAAIRATAKVAEEANRLLENIGESGPNSCIACFC